VLLGAQWHYRELYDWIVGDKAQIKSSQLSEQYNYEQWQENNDAENTVMLFAIDENGNLFWFTADTNLPPKLGWKLFVLSVPVAGKE
jgi:CPA1 family monovalent cation:H+ antiporter